MSRRTPSRVLPFPSFAARNLWIGAGSPYFVVGIAGADGSHLKVLSKIAKIFGRNESVEQLKNAATKEEILEIFGKVTE